MSFKFFERKFAAHFWTQFLGAFNDNIFKNALALLIVYRSVDLFGLGPESVVALAGGVFIFPFFIFSALAGQIADRYEKSKVIRVTKWTELIFMVLAAVGFYIESFSLLMFVLFLMGAQSAIFGPLKYGILPFLVGPASLTKANAFIGAGTFVAILVGTVLGGIAVAQENALVWVSFLVIFVSLVGIVFSLFIPKVESQNKDVRPDWTVVRPIKTLVKNAFSHKTIFKTIMFVSMFWFLGAAILSIIPPLAKDVLYGDELVGTFFLCIFTFGMGIGAFIAERLSQHRAEKGIVAPSALLMGLSLLALALFCGNWPYHPYVLFDLKTFLMLPEAWGVIISIFFMCMFGGMYIIPMMTYIQEKAPQKELSQFIATNNIFNSLMMVLSAVFVMSCYAIGLNIADVILILSLITIVISFFAYASLSEVTIHFLAKFLTKVFFKVEVEGLDNIPSDRPVIYASNHVSYIDWLFIMGSSPRPVRFIIDHFYYYRLPTMPFWFSQARLIPILPKLSNEQVYNQALETVSVTIKGGDVVGIFPEGAITRDGRLRRFQPGLGKIVRDHGVDIVPITLKGVWGSLLSFSGGKLLFKKPTGLRRSIKVIIGKPIAHQDYKVSELRAWMLSNLEE